MKLNFADKRIKVIASKAKLNIKLLDKLLTKLSSLKKQQLTKNNTKEIRDTAYELIKRSLKNYNVVKTLFENTEYASKQEIIMRSILASFKKDDSNMSIESAEDVIKALKHQNTQIIENLSAIRDFDETNQEQISALIGQIQGLSNDLDYLSKENNDLSFELKESIEALKYKIQTEQEILQKLKESNATNEQLEQQKQEIERKKQELLSIKKKLGQELHQTKNEADILRIEVRRLGEEVAQFNEYKSQLSQQLQEQITAVEQETKAKEQTIDKLKQSNATKEQLEQQRQDLLRLSQLFEGLKNQAVEEIHSLDSTNQNQKTELEALGLQIKELEKQLKTAKQLEKGPMEADLKQFQKSRDILLLQKISTEYLELRTSLTTFITAEQKAEEVLNRLIKKQPTGHRKTTAQKYLHRTIKKIQKIRGECSLEGSVIETQLQAIHDIYEKIQNSKSNSDVAIRKRLTNFMKQFEKLESLTNNELHNIKKIEVIVLRAIKYLPKAKPKPKGPPKKNKPSLRNQPNMGVGGSQTHLIDPQDKL